MTTEYFSTDAVGNMLQVGDVVVAANRGGSSEVGLGVVSHITKAGGLRVLYFDIGTGYDVSRRRFQVVKIDNPTTEQRRVADEMMEIWRNKQ